MELSQKSGISQADISRLEKGTRNPSLNLLKRLTEAMDCTLSIEFMQEIRSFFNMQLCEALQSRKYWKNNEWESIEKINAKTLWVTLILMFFCSMIPYATDLVSGDFNNKLDWDHMQ